ncbi:hypothetical protein P691DRAFT_758999 [Macrolepiota fuliginosa MF-IS2]|uniref:G domain-containing protein n=1 Tax=Macrolepiota fuliginosa MF-IS2 TaxID=1400762 RepID=A0A9P6C577_9AGAR|nr:hypothetical protein P691DRAFT_758999 [Macrolepiota fuliginosa MF-IS2]
MPNKYLTPIVKGLSFDHKNIWNGVFTYDSSGFRLLSETSRIFAGSNKNGPGGYQWKPFQKRVNFRGLVVDVVEKKDSTRDDIIIAVLGPTGAGKSTFIEAATGYQGGVGHTLDSCTSEVTAVRVTFMDEIRVVLVDTPGSDDTCRSDLDVLKLISRWLEKTYGDDVKLAGIIYLHRITDNRIACTPFRDLNKFLQLYGEGAFKKVIISTTMWQDSNEEVGGAQETKLVRNCWAEMIIRGSRTARFMNNQQSAWNILNLFAT